MAVIIGFIIIFWVKRWPFGVVLPLVLIAKKKIAPVGLLYHFSMGRVACL